MKIILPLIIALSMLTFAYAEHPMEELPMYGGQHDPEVAPNKENSQSAADLGWKYFYEGDADTAMKRFNQAWMFDRENPKALWGFGVVMGQRAEKEDPEANYKESIKYLSMANSKLPNENCLMVDLAYAHLSLASFFTEQKIKTEAKDHVEEARKLLAQSEEIDPNYPLLHFNGSLLAYLEDDFKTARMRLEKAKSLGYAPDPGYEAELTKVEGR